MTGSEAVWSYRGGQPRSTVRLGGKSTDVPDNTGCMLCGYEAGYKTSSCWRSRQNKFLPLPRQARCLGENRPYFRARAVQPAGNFVIRQFQRLRARDGAVEFDREPRSVVLHDRKLLLEIGAQGVRLGPPLAGRVEPVERGGEPL